MRRYGISGWMVFLLALSALFFGAFLLYPSALMLRRGFGLEGEFTFKYFGLLAASPLLRQSLLNSVSLATLTTITTTLLVLPLAHAFTRWTFSGRTLLTTLLLAPMILPPFVGAIGLSQLLSRFGSVNLLLIRMGWMDPAHPLDWLGAGGFWGIILLQTFSLYPVMYLNISAAMANVDPSLRESAANLGASGGKIFRAVTLPLILPGWFAGAAIVWIWAFTDLGAPLVFGFSRVVPVQIFDAVNDLNTNPQGFALVVVVLAATFGLFMASKRLAGSKRYEMLARGHTAGAELRAGPLGTAGLWVAGLAVAGVALLPHLAVVLQSTAGRWFLTVLPESLQFDAYTEVLGGGMAGRSVVNSLFYAGASVVVDVGLGLFLAWILTRRKLPFAGVIDGLVMLPLAIPGLVLAFGLFAGFDIDEKRHPWLDSMLDPRTNPTFLLVASYAVRRLPYMVRSAVAGFQQTSVALEEASGSFGARPWTTLRRITVPLIAANLVAGAILTFSFAMLEVSDSLILASREQYYPITKSIWALLARIDPRAPNLACALGVVGMLILAGSLALAGRLLGRKLGSLFRA